MSRWFLAIAALPSVAPPRLLLLLKLSHGSSPSHLVMKFEAESFRCHSPVLFRAYIPHFLCSLLVKILTLHRDVLYDMTYVRSSKLTAFLSRPGECFSRADPYNSIECFNGYGRPRLLRVSQLTSIKESLVLAPSPRHNLNRSLAGFYLEGRHSRLQ